jgi:hypothetical protein
MNEFGTFYAVFAWYVFQNSKYRGTVALPTKTFAQVSCYCYWWVGIWGQARAVVTGMDLMVLKAISVLRTTVNKERINEGIYIGL